MKPIIGIIGRTNKLSSSREICYINKEINDAVIKNGGIGIIIPPPTLESLYGKTIEETTNMTELEFEKLKYIINLCDGIICPGGDEFYDYDLKVVEYCYKIDKPLLGICLGMQTMGCLFNGTMLDLNDISHKSEERYVHKIKLNKFSKLYEIFKFEELNVNSRHKSYINKTRLEVSARSYDNIIEAIEDKNKKFFIGVQWHPESMIKYDENQNKLFSYFIGCCKKS